MTGVKDEKTWLGHPRGLTILFLTNMWEQFSYYGMRTLLVYYMTKQLLLAQETSSLIYGLYTGCAYFTPLVGGFIADRFLGKKRAIIIGGSVMACGHFMMTQEPLLKKLLALAHLQAPHFAEGTRVELEVTVEHRRERAAAVVRKLPFFDPERKKS